MEAENAAPLPTLSSDQRSRPPRVIRNAMLLLVAQAIATPLSVLINAVAARTLGPVEFGHLYLAMTYTGFAFLFVEWGQSAILIGKVAVNPERAGELLGSGLLWRVAAALLVSIGLLSVCALAGYEQHFVVVLALTLLVAAFVTLSGACQDVFRGFERMDFAAASYVGYQLLIAAAVVPTLLLGGNLNAMLIAQAVCAAAGSAFVFKMLPRMRVPKLTVRAATLKELFLGGRVFLVYGMVLALQPMIDVAMLSRFGSADSMGWHAAARKLVGLLVYPAAALVGALYPTLCRLHVENPEGYRRTAAEAFRMVVVAAVPFALGCALFPDLGISIFNARTYGPAENNLQVLSGYILLVFFTMPIGTCLVASGRQVAWMVVQFCCVIVSVVCDPVLIVWFQRHTGNGGLGVSVATVASEVLMVGAGLYLMPKGILDKPLLRKLFAAVLSGAAMAAVAWSLLPLNSAVRATLALLAYLVCLHLSGAVNATEWRSMARALRGRWG